MGRGKSQGPPLEYQKLCLAIIRELQFQDNLIPYSGNGIDTLFELCGTRIRLDVALKNPQNDQVVVAECKRYASKYKIEQEALFAFYGKLICLRDSLKASAQGIFVTSSRYREGAIKMGTKMGVKMAVCKYDQSTDDFTVRFVYYDYQRRKVCDEPEIGHKKNSIHAFLEGGV